MAVASIYTGHYYVRPRGKVNKSIRRRESIILDSSYSSPTLLQALRVLDVAGQRLCVVIVVASIYFSAWCFDESEYQLMPGGAGGAPVRSPFQWCLVLAK